MSVFILPAICFYGVFAGLMSFWRDIYFFGSLLCSYDLLFVPLLILYFSIGGTDPGGGRVKVAVEDFIQELKKKRFLCGQHSLPGKSLSLSVFGLFFEVPAAAVVLGSRAYGRSQNKKKKEIYMTNVSLFLFILFLKLIPFRSKYCT